VKNVKRNGIINCRYIPFFINYQQQEISQAIKDLLDGPLIILIKIKQLSRFAAERICSRLNLNFGLPSNSTVKFLKSLPFTIGNNKFY